MDEMMAAMVLTSLSFSPLLHSPKQTDTPAGKLRVIVVIALAQYKECVNNHCCKASSHLWV